MIRIERIPAPSEFEAQAAEAFDRLAKTAEAGGYKSQRRFKFDPEIWLPARSILSVAAHSKCMYCETRVVSASPGEIDHFRPLDRAQGLHRDDISPDHYWWLAYTWENLMFSCHFCSRAKRQRFPVEGRRLEPFESVDTEKRLLLSPFGPEDPALELSFEANGHVVPASSRAEISIEVLTLNRPELVEARAEAAQQLTSVLESAGPSMSSKQVDELAASHHEFAAMRRQLIAGFGMQRLDQEIELSALKTDAEVYAMSDVSVTPPDLTAVWIEHIEFHNFGCITDLQLKFTTPVGAVEPWIVLLGANGVGKSTVLKGIALALAGENDRQRLVPDASRLLNRNVRSRRGHVRMRFNTGEERELVVRKGHERFEVEGVPPHFNLVGYGSTRLLPRATSQRQGQAVGPRLSNLFDPWAPLADGQQWLAHPGEVSANDFRVLASSLRMLLSIETDVELKRHRGSLRANLFNETYGIDELSDGYQSILALALDLSMAFGGEQSQGFSTDNYEGVVLLDELEVHLHPEWKLRVVSDLRAVFPHLQFVATTHDPLCLRGLLPGEIHRLERDDEHRILVQQIDVPPGLDADEILTGEWFDLDSTLDRETQQDLVDYRRLRMQGVLPDSSRLSELQRKLEKSIGSYAGTSIGRILVEAAGELVAEQREGGEKLSKEQIKQRMLEHVRPENS